MRVAPVIAGGLLLVSNAAMSASSDYYLTIDGVGRDTPGGPIFLQVKSSGDLDGDGLPDDAVVKLDCAGDLLRSAYYNVKGPRDAASGQPSGTRMHRPMKIVKEWGPATPELRAMKAGYDVKKVEGTGARAGAAEDGWTLIALDAQGICAAAARAIKTRSNIQNN